MSDFDTDPEPVLGDEMILTEAQQERLADLTIFRVWSHRDGRTRRVRRGSTADQRYERLGWQEQ
jgi:hypothetical protein